MPRQNRVNPCGELIATPCRGTLMGNRGCLHDEHQRIRRPYACKRWICCVLQFRGRQRKVMTPCRYTELFFLDEATALAAGHRPCAECQRARYRLFRATWAAANPEVVNSPTPSADDLDRVLHSERLSPDGTKQTYAEELARLPNGVMILSKERPCLVWKHTLVAWTPGGYGVAYFRSKRRTVQVLTPRSVVRTIAQGYPVTFHPTLLDS